MINQHATAIEWNNIGILFVGPSGCGKSSLAYELIQDGATLIADDQVLLSQDRDNWIATCPETIRNMLHLRDIGLMHVAGKNSCKIQYIFQSDKTGHKISQPPQIGLPVMTLDFLLQETKEIIVNLLTSFDSPCTFA